MLPSTVASPAPTSSIAWCQKIRSPAKNTPAAAASRRSWRVRAPKRRSSKSASTPSTGTAYAQRKIAAVEGDTSASFTRIAENAIVSAPATAASPGRSMDPRDRRDGLELSEPRPRARGHSGSAMQAVPTRSNPSRP